MGEKTGISWTDHTHNFWWGCVRVSDGCVHCYAEAWAERYQWNVWGVNADRRFFDDKHNNEPLNWNKKAQKAGVRRKVFCGSMMDWAEDRPDLIPPRQKMFKIIEATPWLDWLLLTKRPENALQMIPQTWIDTPRPNVWWGTTTENQREADRRIPHLLAIPGVVHFLSAEPLLGPVKLPSYTTFAYPDGFENNGPVHTVLGLGNEPDAQIDWVIAGGESGAGHRHMDPQWALDLKEQCANAVGTAFFVKQMSQDWGPDYKKIEAWPPEFQVQEFPQPHLMRTTLPLGE